jgi:hypothetical protein
MFEHRWKPDGSLVVVKEFEVIHRDGTDQVEVVTKVFRFLPEDVGRLRHILAVGPQPKSGESDEHKIAGKVFGAYERGSGV